MSDFEQFESTVRRVTLGVEGFAADMREKDIHVGMGRNPRCVNCGEAWPCKASGSDDSEVSRG